MHWVSLPVSGHLWPVVPFHKCVWTTFTALLNSCHSLASVLRSGLLVVHPRTMSSCYHQSTLAGALCWNIAIGFQHTVHTLDIKAKHHNVCLICHLFIFVCASLDQPYSCVPSVFILHLINSRQIIWPHVLLTKCPMLILTKGLRCSNT